MAGELTAGEVAAWQAYYGVEPWGEERADLRMGILAATIVNVIHAALTGKPGKAKPADFMPNFDQLHQRPEDQPVDVNSLVVALESLQMVHGGRIVRDGE